MMNIAFYDLETANDPSEVGWRNFHAIQIACIGVASVKLESAPAPFDAAPHVDLAKPVPFNAAPTPPSISFRVFESAKDAAKYLDDHDLVVGFNNHKFDNHVIMRHGRGDFEFPFKSLDILEDLEIRTDIKFLTNLDVLSRHTVGETKTDGVDGASAPELWRQGKKDLVRAYCLQDCWITYKVFEFGMQYGYVLVPPNHRNESLFGNMALRVPVTWKERVWGSDASKEQEEEKQTDDPGVKEK